MNFSELKALTLKLLAYDLDGYDGASPSDSQVYAVLNWALRSIGLSIYLYEEVEFTLANGVRQISLDDTTTFGKAIITVDQVMVEGAYLRDFTRRVGMWRTDQFTRWYRDASTVASDLPVAVTVMGNSLSFNCPSDDNYECSLWGRVFPAPIVASSHESPDDIPTHLHEAIAYIAAVKWAMPNATVDDQYRRLQTYSGEAIDILVAEFKRGYKEMHGRDPEISILRESCAAFKTVERGSARGSK